MDKRDKPHDGKRKASTATAAAPRKRDGAQRFLLKLEEALRPLGEPQAVRAEAAKQLGSYLEVDRAFCAEVDGGGDTFLACGYCRDGAPAVAGRYRLDDLGLAAAESMRAGRALVVADIEASDEFADAEKRRCRESGIAAALQVPLVEDGRLKAFLALHQSTPRAWTPGEVALATGVAERTRAEVVRTQAKAALRISEEKYRSLFDSIDQGACVMEVEYAADGRIAELYFREVNAAFERQGGFHDVVGKPVSRFMPSLEQYWRDAHTRAMQDGQPTRVENYLADRERWYSVQFARIGGPGSRLLAAVFEDITVRKDAERVVTRLAEIIESSDDAIVSKNLDGIIQTWNAGAERMFGYTPEEAIGKPITILMPPDRLDEEPGILARIRRGERIDHYETVRQHKNGTRLDISLTVSPIVDREGKVVAASKIARNITQRKRTETMLAERDARQRFRLKLADMVREQPDERAIGEVVARMLARHLYADRCFVIRMSRAEDWARLGAEYRRANLPSIFGATDEVRVSGFPTCLRTMGTDPVVVHDIAGDARFAAAERSAITALRGMTAFIAAPLSEGTRVWAVVAGSATARHWSPEEVQLVEDVAERAWAAIERARVELALQENQARLQQANRAKDEFIAMLSHELRNPLAPIATTLQLMKLRAPAVFARERSIIETQVRDLTALVDDLLDVTRIARGKVELKTEAVAVEDVVATAVGTTRNLLEERRQSLQTDVERDLMVSGDRRRLVQVLVNLLSNASKYSPPDNAIRLGAVAENGLLVVRVRDQGQGIEPELLPRVFELFTQSAQSIDRAHGGLGLGLAIVRNLVMLHGGSVEASSEGRGKGSEFTVRLPLLERRRESGGDGVVHMPR
ncbi:MAG: PAS domain S-box protein, partial [Rhodanobacteraceae bacterium]